MEQHQVKSKWYYIFWGVCTVSVLTGQMYVGTGYREMADAYTENTNWMRNTVDRVMPRW